MVPKVSIIIPVKGLKGVTQVCLDSLRLYPPESYELILVDDGTSDERTSEFLRETQKDKLIVHEKSFGWCKAINSGLKESTGDYAVFSNNDVAFTPKWSEKMLAHFAADKTLGVLGCTTNQVEGFQHMVHNRPGVDFQYTDALTFFLVMVRKEVIDKIGGLDERFDPGGQDDADYCLRARQAGWKVGIARDVFVYHYGSATFREEFRHDAAYSREYAASRRKILESKYHSPKRGGVTDGRKRIFICIPTLRGAIVPGLVDALLYWTHNDRYIVKAYMPEGLSPLANVCNHCIKEFLEQDFDYLWWIDDDIIPPVETIDRFIKADKDVIAAVCFSMKSKDGEYFPYPVTLRYNEDKQYAVYYGQGVEEVDAVGTACVMVKRKVYEVVERPFEDKYHKDGTLALTCVFRACQKIQEKGFKIFVDFGLLCSHQRKVDIKGIQNLLASLKK